MAFRVLIEKRAARQLEKTSKDVKPKITESLNELKKGFSARLDIKELKAITESELVITGFFLY